MELHRELDIVDCSVQTPGWMRCSLTKKLAFINQCNENLIVLIKSYLEIGACRVPLHDGENEPSSVPRDQEFVRLVLG